MVRVVLVHGFTQGERSWEPIRGALADAVALRVPDNLDFVATAHALGNMGGHATYVGYSMGGRLCLQLALDRSPLVERLVLVSASPGIGDDTERLARLENDRRLAHQVERDGVDAFLENWLAQPMFASLPRDRAGLEERRTASTVDRLTHQLLVLGQGTQPDNWGRLGELSMPVLVVAGALDTKYVDIAHRMGAAIPNARVEIVDGAGHACHLERPEGIAQLLASW